jgi:hypothetical protein
MNVNGSIILEEPMIAFLVVGLDSLLALGFCVLVARAFRRWHGLWRWALWIPIVMIAAVTLSIVSTIRIDATAHNLWPLEIMGWLCLSNGLMAVLYLARWIATIIQEHRFRSSHEF